MTGFAVFQDDQKDDSFQCFGCDAIFTCGKAAASHIREFHLDDDEDEDIGEEIDQDDKDQDVEDQDINEEDESFILQECDDPFAKMHQWMDPNSILSHEYKKLKKAFGHAECPFCSSIFGSKIAWIHHIIENHDIQPDRNYLCDAKIIDSVRSLKSIFDGISVSTSGEKILVPTNNENEFDIDSDPDSPIITPRNPSRSVLVGCPDNQNSISPDYRQMYNDEHFEPNPPSGLQMTVENEFEAMCSTLSAEGVVVINEDGTELDGFFAAEEIDDVVEVVTVDGASDAESVKSTHQKNNPVRKPRSKRIDEIFSTHRKGLRRTRRFESDVPELDVPEPTDEELQSDAEYLELINECKSNKI